MGNCLRRPRESSTMPQGGWNVQQQSYAAVPVARQSQSFSSNQSRRTGGVCLYQRTTVAAARPSQSFLSDPSRSQVGWNFEPQSYAAVRARGRSQSFPSNQSRRTGGVSLYQRTSSTFPATRQSSQTPTGILHRPQYQRSENPVWSQRTPLTIQVPPQQNYSQNQVQLSVGERRTKRYDVFLSFYGEDTRHNFTAFLHKSLIAKGIITFLDAERIQKGSNIPESLVHAIENSLFAIPIISENYAESEWCLAELQRIIERKKQVFPIFFNVAPSELTKLQTKFGQYLAKHKEKFNASAVQRWEYALRSVREVDGWVIDNTTNQADVTQQVIERIWTCLRSTLTCDHANFVGAQEKIIETTVKLDILRIPNAVGFVGIWGERDVGKTTLAELAYQRMYPHFEVRCFLKSIGNNFVGVSDIIRLQTHLLGLLEINGINITHPEEGRMEIERHFRDKEVLLILDDITHMSQLENLAGSSLWFGNGSRILITTRNKGLLDLHSVTQNVELNKAHQQTIRRNSYAAQMLQPQRVTR